MLSGRRNKEKPCEQMNQNHPKNRQPQTQSTQKDPQSPMSSTPEPTPAPDPNSEMLKQLLAILAPVVDFHKAVDSASDNDLRVYWDIRLVQGKDTPFTSMSGHSSFPGVLIGSALGQLPSMMSREIVEKVAVPLSARLHDMTNANALSRVMKNITAEVNAPAPNHNAKDAAAAQELISEVDRTDLIDAMLPRDIVEAASGIITELKKHE